MRDNPFDTIVDRVCFECSVFRGDLLAGSRSHSARLKHIVLARQMLYYALKEKLGWSYPAIGKAVGGRDHTTVMAGVSKVKTLLESESAFTTEAMSRILADFERPKLRVAVG